MSLSSKFIEPKEELLEPPICNWSEAQVTACVLKLMPEVKVGGSLVGLNPLTVESDAISPEIQN